MRPDLVGARSALSPAQGSATRASSLAAQACSSRKRSFASWSELHRASLGRRRIEETSLGSRKRRARGLESVPVIQQISLAVSAAQREARGEREGDEDESARRSSDSALCSSRSSHSPQKRAPELPASPSTPRRVTHRQPHPPAPSGHPRPLHRLPPERSAPPARPTPPSMAYRPSSQSYAHEHPSYELQSRYSQQFDRSSPSAASPASPTSPAPGFLRDQQAHARYSSADLYALEQPPAPPSHASGSSLLARPQSNPRAGVHSEDDDDEEDDGAGFGTYRDLTPAGARGAARYSQPPPFVSYVRHSPPRASPASSADAPSSARRHPTATSSYSGYDAHNASKDAFASTTKFGGETIDAPILSRADWAPGEAAREKHEHSTEKKRRKRQNLAGEVKGARDGVFGFVRRNWKWLLPLFLVLSVACVLLSLSRSSSRALSDVVVPPAAVPSSSATSSSRARRRSRSTRPRCPNPPLPRPTPSPTSLRPTRRASSSTATSSSPVRPTFPRLRPLLELDDADPPLLLAVDASDSYLPVKYNTFGLTVRMQETEAIIAQATWDNGEISVPAKKVTSYEVRRPALSPLSVAAELVPTPLFRSRSSRSPSTATTRARRTRRSPPCVPPAPTSTRPSTARRSTSPSRSRARSRASSARRTARPSSTP